MSTARESLHELCSDYFHGLIPFDAYRLRRGQLLDEVVLSQSAPPDHVATEHTEQPRSKPTPALEPQPATAAPALGTRVYALGAAAAIVFAIGLALFLVLTPRHETAGDVETAIPPVGKAPTIAESQAAAAPGAFIDRFVEADTWSEATLSAFLFDWDQLTEDDRAIIRESQSFRALADSLRNRLLELRALAEPSDSASVERFRLVSTFAGELNVDTGVSDLDLRKPATEVSGPADLDTSQPAATVAAGSADEPAKVPPLVAGRSESVAPPPPVGTTKTTREDPPPKEVVSKAPSPPKAAPASSPVAKPATKITDARAAPDTRPEKRTAPPAETSSANATAAANPAAPTTAAPTTAAPAAVAPTTAAPTTVAPTTVAPATAASATAAAPGGSRPCRKEIAAVPVATRRACYDVFDGARGPLLAVVPPGSFTMGSAEDKAASPPHPVAIAMPFALAVYETTVGELRRFCAETSRSCSMLTVDDDYPAVGMTWQDAADYTSWLSARTGATYRLPTEAEWEYAARAGTSTRYPFGDEVNQAQAVFAAGNVAAPLPRSRSVVANEFGLRHMVGNVREWVADAWSAGYADAPNDGGVRSGGGDLRVARGGSFGDTKAEVTSASRRGSDPLKGNDRTGFRVLREL